MRTRFAPSLTGYLHLGHVLHLLYVWGVARERKAQVLCRIEDHDLGRARAEYEVAIVANMEWLGFVPDLGISASTVSGRSEYRQSDCGEYYMAALKLLQDRGLVYGCSCSRREIAAAQLHHAGELCYSGVCREKGLPLEGNTVRVRVPDDEITFLDLKMGRQRQNPRKQCGDFSLRDRQGQWTYQFACVCDDIRQGIDLVVRGEDILFSTARQMMLFDWLGADVPTYYHHPLICDARGKKLSKRQHSESIALLRGAGATPEQVLGRALFAGGFISEFRAVSQHEAFSLVRMS